MGTLKVLVLNQYFTPDNTATGQLLGDLCRGLADKGLEVTVVCSFPNYTDQVIPAPARERDGNLMVYRVGFQNVRGRRNMLVRVTGYLGYLWGAVWRGVSLTRFDRYDVVMTVSNPPVIGAIGAWIARRKGIPFVYILHDLHPDVMIATGKGRSLPQAAISAWNRLNDFIFSHACRIVVLSPGMGKALGAKGVDPRKLDIVHNWAHPEFEYAAYENEFRAKLCLKPGTRLVLYSGNHGISHNLDWLLVAAAELQGAPLHFVFIGEGAKKADLMALSSRLGLGNVTFLPYQTEDGYRLAMAAADISAVALEPGLEGLAVPSKTYSILSSGRPVLAIMSSTNDVARMVTEGGCGWVAESASDVARVLKCASEDGAALEEMGERARRLYIDRFSLSRAVREYEGVIKRAASGADIAQAP